MEKKEKKQTFDENKVDTISNIILTSRYYLQFRDKEAEAREYTVTHV